MTIEQSNPSIGRRAFVKLGLAASVAAATGTSASAQTPGAAAGAHSLPALGYAFDALAPHIDAQTMEIHHGKHHAGYITNLNKALADQPDLRALALLDLVKQVASIKDEALRTTVRNNAGGHLNHNLFWEILGPPASAGTPSAALDKALQDAFGGREPMQKAIQSAAMARFGSGWAWLVVRNGKLAITTTPNQDHPQMAGIIPAAETGTPILGIDVWEHAYYLNYQNRRADYLAAIWNVIQWNKVSEKFAAAAG